MSPNDIKCQNSIYSFLTGSGSNKIVHTAYIDIYNYGWSWKIIKDQWIKQVLKDYVNLSSK